MSDHNRPPVGVGYVQEIVSPNPCLGIRSVFNINHIDKLFRLGFSESIYRKSQVDLDLVVEVGIIRNVET
jgi:hypothetical protein